MTQSQAISLWTELCNTVHGVDSDGDPVGSLTELGKIAVSHGLKTWYSDVWRDPNQIAEWLEGWAASMRTKPDDQQTPR